MLDDYFVGLLHNINTMKFHDKISRKEKERLEKILCISNGEGEELKKSPKCPYVIKE